MQRHAKLVGQYSKLQEKTEQNRNTERERKRAILLSSNKNNSEPFQWPRVFNYGLDSARFLANNSIYTTPRRKTVLRPKKRNRFPEKTKCDIEGARTNIRRPNHFLIALESYAKNKVLEDAKDQVLEHALDSVIEEIRPIDCNDSQGTDSLAVRHLTIEMIEQLFQNMANTDQVERKADYDWEYVLGKAIETGLPAPVIERVRQRMTRVTKKESQAIAALNTPKHNEFVDLTEPIAEAEVKKIVLDISSNKEHSFYTNGETRDRDEEQEMFERYIALTKDSEHLSSRVQSIHDIYNQQVFKTESRYEK